MIFQVAILGVPLRRTFDYLPPEKTNPLTPQPGMRVRVPFGRQQRIGVILQLETESHFDQNKLKPVVEIVDEQPLLPTSIHQLLLETARYYHHPIGEVYETALPVLVRQGKAAVRKPITHYHATAEGHATNPETLNRAPRQQQLLTALHQQPLTAEMLRTLYAQWREPMKKLMEKGLVEAQQVNTSLPTSPNERPHMLNTEQQQAVEAIIEQQQQPQPHPILLEGVTGSGKTEVYLQTIESVIAAGKQALILVPEIALTPQTVHRFQARFSCPIALLHSARNRSERMDAWLQAREGEAAIIIGTRSALFTPLLKPGLIIVDEEHDSSFKQQEGFRYSARDCAVLRGHREKIPVILGSATPSFETLHNCSRDRYRKLLLQQRAGDAKPPTVSLIDVRSRKLTHLLSAPLLEKISQHLQQQGQVLLFLNRRGYAPTLLCRSCGWSILCPRCEIHYTYHQQSNRLICHHCGGERPLPQRCPECSGEDMKPYGAGTERIEEALQQHYPEHSIARIDRDSTQRKGSMDTLLQEIQQEKHQLLIGTQMLAKGHHFPNVTLVAILDADGGLFGSDFRAVEQMGQLITQVAGRAGRAKRAGEMVLQTHHPDHPLLVTLLRDGYPTFAQQALSERKLAELPPYSHLALLRAESAQLQPATQFLQQVREVAQPMLPAGVEILGPIPSPMEKRAGRYRMQLLLQAKQRTPLHQLLNQLIPTIEAMKEGRKVRWSLDVDPIDML